MYVGRFANGDYFITQKSPEMVPFSVDGKPAGYDFYPEKMHIIKEREFELALPYLRIERCEYLKFEYDGAVAYSQIDGKVTKVL